MGPGLLVWPFTIKDMEGRALAMDEPIIEPGETIKDPILIPYEVPTVDTVGPHDGYEGRPSSISRVDRIN